jgi:hypothetical protein
LPSIPSTTPHSSSIIIIIRRWENRPFSGHRSTPPQQRKGEEKPCNKLGGLQACEMLRALHFLDNRLIDGGYIVSLTSRPRFIHRIIFWYTFLLEDE